MRTRDSETSINFSNRIGAENIERFIAALQAGTFVFAEYPTSCATLYFENNFLSMLNCNEIEKLMNVIKQTHIRNLYLGGNNIGYCTKEQIQALANGFKNIEVLHLNDNQLHLFSTNHFKLFIKGLNSLKELHINNNHLTQMDTKKFISLMQMLKKINLHMLNVSDTPLHPAPLNTWQMVLQELNDVCYKTKNLVRSFYFWHPLTQQITVNHLVKQENISSAAISVINEIQKKIASNCLQDQKPHSLKDWCIFTLYKKEIRGNQKNVPTDLQTEIAEISGRLKL